MNFWLAVLATSHRTTLPITPGFGAMIRTIVNYAARSKHQGCCRSTCAIRFNSATSAIYCLTTRCLASMETNRRNSTVSMPKTKSQRHHIMASLLTWTQISQAALLARQPSKTSNRLYWTTTSAKQLRNPAFESTST